MFLLFLVHKVVSESFLVVLLTALSWSCVCVCVFSGRWSCDCMSAEHLPWHKLRVCISEIWWFPFIISLPFLTVRQASLELLLAQDGVAITHGDVWSDIYDTVQAAVWNVNVPWLKICDRAQHYHCCFSKLTRNTGNTFKWCEKKERKIVQIWDFEILNT